MRTAGTTDSQHGGATPQIIYGYISFLNGALQRQGRNGPRLINRLNKTVINHANYLTRDRKGNDGGCRGSKFYQGRVTIEFFR